MSIYQKVPQEFSQWFLQEWRIKQMERTSKQQLQLHLNPPRSPIKRKSRQKLKGWIRWEIHEINTSWKTRTHTHTHKKKKQRKHQVSSSIASDTSWDSSASWVPAGPLWSGGTSVSTSGGVSRLGRGWMRARRSTSKSICMPPETGDAYESFGIFANDISRNIQDNVFWECTE